MDICLHSCFRTRFKTTNSIQKSISKKNRKNERADNYEDSRPTKDPRRNNPQESEAQRIITVQRISRRIYRMHERKPQEKFKEDCLYIWGKKIIRIWKEIQDVDNEMKENVTRFEGQKKRVFLNFNL